ncbi:MAG: hemerythrin [FCB group bacterium]|nr:hemerythrin [FCB group bacterium]
MKPTEQLTEEHNSIKLMLMIMSNVCEKLEAGEKVKPEHLQQIIEFIKVFADKCHHGKEEDLLFQAMIEVGFPRDAGPIGVMLYEHGAGRDYVKKMSDAAILYGEGDGDASSVIVENARSYISLLTQHIDKEDHILYPMADGQLSEAKQQELSDKFEIVNRDQIGQEKIDEMLGILNQLKEIYLV